MTNVGQWDDKTGNMETTDWEMKQGVVGIDGSGKKFLEQGDLLVYY